MDSKRLEGCIKWMDAKKGIGMIKSEHTDGDVFFHFTELKIQGYKYLPPETRVEFTLVCNKASSCNNGKKAVDIHHLV
ncbi:cold-shock DNA-binding domain protein [Vibrio phage Va2]|nr:cold-shock DNA-binding domain protein [Vibrio phage Va2]